MSNINIFINSNSSAGFVSYYDSNTAGLKHAVSLSSYPSVAAEDIIKSVIANTPDAEIIHNCIDNRIEGVILPGQSASVINIPAYCTQSRLIGIPENLVGFKECKNHLNEAYRKFAEALKIHDSLEKIYLDNINFDALDALELRLENIIFDIEFLGKTPSVRDRFFGAATADGSKDYVENITEGCKKRYFIKGRPGSGKSTIMKKLLKKACEMGIDTDVYHCAFDPKSLDMLVFKDLNVCIFDSTAPHEYFPSLESDEIVDVCKEAIKEGTDEKYKAELDAIKADYASHIAAATGHLKSARECYERVNRKYLERIDYAELENVKDVILNKIFG